jgi:hypothetical protein
VQEAVKVMAKSLVRNRHAVNKLFQLKSQLQAVSLRIAVSAGVVWCGVEQCVAILAFRGGCWVLDSSRGRRLRTPAAGAAAGHAFWPHLHLLP